MRTRELVNTATKIGTWHFYNDNPCDQAWSIDAQVEYVAASVYKGMLDVVTPNYKKLSAQGAIINNPMLSITKTMESCAPTIHSNGPAPNYNCSAIVTFKTGLDLPDNTSDMPGLDWLGWDSFLAGAVHERDYAVTQAWANVDLSEAAALASLGEAPETLRWLLSIVQRFHNLIKLFSYKRGIRNALRWAAKSDRNDLVDTVSDIWLELRYALRPLVFEAQQCLAALEATVAKNSRSTARGYNRSEHTETTTHTVPWTNLGSCEITRIRTVRANYRAGVLYEVGNANDILSLWGLDQPLETVWELIPFSFIIDWFLNIGSIISSWTPNASLHPLTSWVTETFEITTYDSTPGLVYNQAWSYIGHPFISINPGYKKTTVLVKRRLPTPDRAVLPTFKLKLDVSKITDLLLITRKILFS